jgi:uncharacterized protein YodC (DUF2158 family)
MEQPLEQMGTQKEVATEKEWGPRMVTQWDSVRVALAGPWMEQPFVPMGKQKEVATEKEWGPRMVTSSWAEETPRWDSAMVALAELVERVKGPRWDSATAVALAGPWMAQPSVPMGKQKEVATEKEWGPRMETQWDSARVALAERMERVKGPRWDSARVALAGPWMAPPSVPMGKQKEVATEKEWGPRMVTSSWAEETPRWDSTMVALAELMERVKGVWKVVMVVVWLVLFYPLTRCHYSHLHCCVFCCRPFLYYLLLNNRGGYRN